MPAPEKLTPLMRQYWEIKSFHQDKILFFRMGDFFELFYDDAVTAAPILGIALTARNRKSEDETPMCGVPHHSVPGHINKLLKSGRKVALCDQIEDPKEAKGIVKRAVTRVLSPGMVYDPDQVESGRAHYLCAYDEQAIAFLDATTGEAFYFECEPSDQATSLAVFRPVELVLTAEQLDRWTQAPLVYFPLHTSQSEEASLRAWERLSRYAIAMQGEDLRRTLPEFERRTTNSRMKMSAQTLRHLEVFENYRGETRGTLFAALDRTQTSGGARFLRYWLSTPSCDSNLLKSRHDSIEFWIQDPAQLKRVRAGLRSLGDLERRIMKLSHPSCNARDLVSLAQSVQAGFEVESVAHTSKSDICHTVQSVVEKLLCELVEEPPVSIREAHLFRSGVSVELDDLISLTDDAESKLVLMEQDERARTGIGSLKIRFNSVFGFYIEVPHAHRERIPAEYQRKQTLANAERYITPSLIELEQKILSARVKRERLEFEMFGDWKQKLVGHVPQLLKLAHAWSELDVITGLAWLALEKRYVRPRFVTEHLQSIRLEASRHPVVEELSERDFVANDIHLEKGECLLLTGPNMAGKSTLMRQVALTALLAQIGSFVPAARAELPLFTHLLTRIGSSDALWDGLSTFMVEMTETAALLNEAGPRALVVLDEVGRGTSTFDGMSLAQAILEHLVQKQATTLFATHYHELTSLADHVPQIRNGHMSLNLRGDQLSFLYTLKPGAAVRSYGIQVGKRAGLPHSVIQRAMMILSEKERASRALEQQLQGPQLSLFGLPSHSKCTESET